ncbi:transcription initiation factor TFIID subunit 3 isoform X3 [Aethina tumida]|uniref:transcription initiation factor TFIID subunit 3 isoform X3 n=1 Tax=Aethina tumida TaxID=116153 RepID=UPI0021484C59|nr:transcription initiation factor TFIID subunit 3 isoform X3 [Aethina tumida]
MSAEYTREHLKLAIAKILQTLGWHSIQTTPLEVLADILSQFMSQLTRTTNEYANEFGQTQPNLDHLGLAFRDMGINVSELEEYVKYVNFAAPPAAVPKYPIPKETNLNFLKPGSKEVVTRPVHIHEHLPPMYPLLEGADNDLDLSEMKKEIDNVSDTGQVFKKPADVSPTEFKRSRREDEGSSRPTREISSVMMTTSGFLSPAREGKLPEAKTPVQALMEPVLANNPPTTQPPEIINNDPPKKIPKIPNRKIEKKKDKIGKELFKPLLFDDKTPVRKSPTNMKDVAKFKQKNNNQSQQMSQSSPLVDMQRGGTPINSKAHKINKTLADARQKTEKLNTTITPIPMKPETISSSLPPQTVIDKINTEPDKKKVNIFKKISVKNEKHDLKHIKKEEAATARSRGGSPNLIIDDDDERDDIARHIPHHLNIPSDVTIEPINPQVVPKSSPERIDYFDSSPPGTPSTPKTPEMISSHSPPLPLTKEKRKKKEGKRVKKVQKQSPITIPPPLDYSSYMEMDRPKTPEADIIMKQDPPIHHPNLLLPPPFLMGLGGIHPLWPGLIPSHPIFPFPSSMPNFGKNPFHIPPMMHPNMPPVVGPQVSSAANHPPSKGGIQEEESPPAKVSKIATPSIPVASSSPASSSPPPPEIPDPVVTNHSNPDPKPEKKSKEHKKEKKDKIKKKNKKDKIKDKAEKKKLKEEKKLKEKTKKEKKDKKKDKELFLKLGSPPPPPRADTPETSTRKLNIKPIVKKKEEEPAAGAASSDERHRETSPGLVKISALVTGPPKPKTTSSPAQAAHSAYNDNNYPSTSTDILNVEKKKLFKPIPKRTTKEPKRRSSPEILPPPTQSHSHQQPTPSSYIDEEGNQVWICPACNLQDDGSPMIGCDGCDAWYHWVCVRIQVPPDENENWYCKHCLPKNTGDSQTDKKNKKRKKKEKKEH